MAGLATQSAARLALGELVFGSTAVAANLRERAARAFAATVPADEAQALAARAEGIVDAELRAALREGLLAAAAQ